MDFQKMVRSVEAAGLPDAEILIRDLSKKLPRVYTEKSVGAFCDAFLNVLSIGIKLDYSTMMLYLPARPQVCESLVVQFQQINKTIATRHDSEIWFHDLFGLFLGMAAVLGLSWEDIESQIVGKSECRKLKEIDEI